MTFTQFNKIQRKLVDDSWSEYSYYIKSHFLWDQKTFRRINSVHKKIRKILGGEKICFDVSIRKINFLCTLSTTPVAFFMLGNYGSDHSSCWKVCTGCDNKQRLNMALHPYSFVLHLKTSNDEDEKPYLASSYGRMLGYIIPDGIHRTISLWNYYGRGDFSTERYAGVTQRPLLKSLCRQVGNQIFGVKNFDIVIQHINPPFAYCNHSGMKIVEK